MTTQTLSLFDTPLDVPPGPPASFREVEVSRHTRRVRGQGKAHTAPETLPYAKGSATSREAAQKALPDKGTQEARVLATLRCFGGLTDEELGSHLSAVMIDSTARARRIGLRDKGRVVDSGRKRLTKSGNPATVWEVTK